LPLKEKFGIPLVVTLHNYGLICPVLTLTKDGEQCQSILTNKCVSCGRKVYGAKSLLVYLFLRLNKSRLKQVDKFVAISNYQRSVYSKYLGLNETDIAVIPNSIDSEKFSRSKYNSEKTRREFEKLGVDRGTNKIIHISALSGVKLSSITGIINATPKIIKKFPRTQVLIVGNGKYFDNVARLAGKVNQRLKKQAITMAGFVKCDDMPKIMSLADIVIGVGRVALEAMACEKPVIIAGTSVGPFGGNYGGIVTKSNVDELRAHNFSGRNSFEKTTPDKIAEDCIRLLEDREYRLSLGSFGREYVKQEHNIRKAVQKVEAVYLDVIKGSK
jgi:glycosyltransferase involved in cell wall biosynthesis